MSLHVVRLPARSRCAGQADASGWCPSDDALLGHRYEKYTKEDADKLVKHEDAFAECAADIRADIEILLEVGHCTVL